MTTRPESTPSTPFNGEWIEGDFEGHLVGHGDALVGEASGRVHSLSCLGGRLRDLTASQDPAGQFPSETAPRPLELARAPHVWVSARSHDDAGHPTWYETTLHRVVLTDYRYRLVSDEGDRSVFHVEGRLVGLLLHPSVAPRAPLLAVDREPHLPGCGPGCAPGCLTLPFLYFKAGPRGCLASLLLGGLLFTFGLLFCGFLMGLLWLAVLLLAGRLRQVRHERAWPGVDSRTAHAVSGILVLTQLLVLCFAWGRWLGGPCEESSALTILLLALPPLAVGAVGRRWWTYGSIALWFLSLPVLCTVQGECKESRLEAVRAALNDHPLEKLTEWLKPAPPEDADGAVIAEATRNRPSARRLSLEEAISTLSRGEPICDRSVFISGGFLFAPDDDRLQPGAADVLARLRDAIAPVPGARLVVEGHSDRQQGTVDNDVLSQRRAEAVARIFAEKLPAQQLEVHGHGARRPVVDDSQDLGLAKFNRRVEVKIECPTP